MNYIERTTTEGEEILGKFRISNKFKTGVIITLTLALILILFGSQMDVAEGKVIADAGSSLITIGGILLIIYYSSSTTITSRRVVQKLPAGQTKEMTFDMIESLSLNGNSIVIKGTGGSEIKTGPLERAHEAVKLINKASENYKK